MKPRIGVCPLRLTHQTSYVKATHRDSTSAAQHKTQGKHKTGNWKIDCETKEGKSRTLLYLPSLKSLNYYWLLIVLI
jgi:hypothetical protein